MARYKDAKWNLPDNHVGYDHATLAVLMDIRDELKAIRSILNCPRIPAALDAMARIDRIGVKRRAPARKRAK